MIYNVRDNRITILATAYAIVKTSKSYRKIYVFKGYDNAIAVFLFGHLIYKKGWRA